MEAELEKPTEAVKFQAPVTVSAWEREAGPPVPQSKDKEALIGLVSAVFKVKWAVL